MNKEKEKYNSTKARYLARLVLQNRYNKNRGLPYEKAVAENTEIKASIDYRLRSGQYSTDSNHRPLPCFKGDI